MFRIAAVLCVYVLSSVYAKMSDDKKEELTKIIEPLAKACMEKLGLNAEALEEMKAKKNVDPCFVACVLKATGIIDSNGKFDNKPFLHLAKQVFEEKEVLDQMVKIGEICIKVNDENVADECGRAKLLMQCAYENMGDIEDL